MSIVDSNAQGTLLSVLSRIGGAAILLLAVTTGYFLVPADRLTMSTRSITVLLFAIGVPVAATLVIWQVRSYRRHAAGGTARALGLITILYLTMLMFALCYFAMASRHPEEFASLHTRVDALYFSFSVVSTVGFGDVHAAGQAARAAVVLQMAFDLIFISLALAAVRAPTRPPGSPEM